MRPQPGNDNFANKITNAGPRENFTNDIIDDDDDFMDIHCHIDEATKIIIRKGGFVEIVKLRPKELNNYEQEDEKIELVRNNGQTYYIPAKPKANDKINNVKKWDEAFRVYAAIYSEANPTRSSEILQYIHMIHNAARSFAWENVVRYDYIFRQKMAKRPSRSWARINSQLWSISMVNPLQRNFGNSSNQNNNNTQNGKQDLRKICCWRYNRNKCTKTNCRFEHRCSYCGNINHIYLNCPKRSNNKQKQASENNNGAGKSSTK